MTDPLTDFLEDRVRAATPSALTGFDDVRRRARRQRLRVVGAAAAAFVVVAGVGLAGWTMRGDRPGAVDPATTPKVSAPTASTSPLPTTGIDPGVESGLVARLPDGDLALPANDRCWGAEDCRRALMWQQTGPDLGSPSEIDFTFARPGWEFFATFTRLDDACPRATTVTAEPTGDRSFRLAPADVAGTYQVDLFGSGREGSVSSRFVWTTTTDGPVDSPTGKLHVAPETRTGPAHAMEIAFDDLGFQPNRSEVGSVAAMTIVAADGTRSQIEIPLETQSLPCYSRGSFYYQGEWLTEITPRGPAPWDVEVTVTIRGTEHVGVGTWPGPSSDPNLNPYIPLEWEPALPE
jgi:hypothetical protein